MGFNFSVFVVEWSLLTFSAAAKMLFGPFFVLVALAIRLDLDRSIVSTSSFAHLIITFLSLHLRG